MLRIFLTSSQLSTVYMSVFAKKSKIEGCKDVLIIDNFYKKKSLLKLIEDAASFHNWDLVIDLSIKIDDTQNLKPTFKKILTRRVKNIPLIKNIYTRLLNKNQQIYTQKYKEIIKLKLGVFFSTEKVQLNLLTQTALNKALHSLFPIAETNYFEHGQGDYYYVLKPELTKGNFYCVFSELYKNYLHKKKIDSKFVRSYLDLNDFEESITIAGKSCAAEVNEIRKKKKKYILFLMDSLEIYYPPINFWTDYVERCIKEIDNANDFCWIVKPHPNQSNEVLQITKDFFEKTGLDFIMLDGPKFIPLSVEYIFVSLSSQIEAVFTTFSSAIFYLSYFYPNKSKYFILYDFVGKYFGNAPKQYATVYKDLAEMYSGMFSELPLKKIK